MYCLLLSYNGSNFEPHGQTWSLLVLIFEQDLPLEAELFGEGYGHLTSRKTSLDSSVTLCFINIKKFNLPYIFLSVVTCSVKTGLKLKDIVRKDSWADSVWKWISIPFFSGKDSWLPWSHVSWDTPQSPGATTHSHYLRKPSDKAAVSLFTRLALSGQQSVSFSLFKYQITDMGATDYIWERRVK